MKQTQLICDLCHDVITEYTVPGQLTCGSLGLGASVVSRTAYRIDLKYGTEPQKPKRVRLDICPKCLYRLEHWNEILQRDFEERIRQGLKERGVES